MRSNCKNRKRRGRSEGSIFQREDGLWAATISLGYDTNGKRIRKTVYGGTKGEVQEKLRKLQTDAGNGRNWEADRLTVQAFLDRWLKDVAKPKVAPTTWNRYEQHVRLHLVPHLGQVHLGKLTALHVQQLFAAMEQAGDSAAERKKVGVVLRMALRQACRLRLLPYNPAADVPLPKPHKREMRPLNAAQVPRFLEAAEPDRLFAMYVLAIDSGMRQGELFGLQWPDVDFEAGSIQVQRSLEEIKGRLRLKETKTGKARRRINLAPSTLEVLNRHRQRMLAEGLVGAPVFCDTGGSWLRKSNVSRRSFKPILARANARAVKRAKKQRTAPALLPPIRFHDLRHTCATLLLMSDVNVKVVSERLGHASIELTLNTYSHVLPTMQEKAAASMDRILGKKKATG